jgi:hypothetical protein
MELDERFVDVIVKRYIKYKNSAQDCYLLRNGKEIPITHINDFQILSL